MGRFGQLGQDLFGVGAGNPPGDGGLGRGRLELPRDAVEHQRAIPIGTDLDQVLVGGHLGMVSQLVEVEQPAVRDVEAGAAQGPPGGRARGHDRGQAGCHLVAPGQTAGVGGQPHISSEVRRVEGGAEPGPLLVAFDGDGQPTAVGAAEGLVRRGGGRCRTERNGGNPGGGMVGQVVRLQRQGRGQHLELDVLAATRTGPYVQRGEHRFHDHRAGGEIEMGVVPEQLTVPTRLAVDRGPAAERLQQRIDAGLGGHRTHPTVCRRRHVDDVGTSLRHLGVAQAELLHRTGSHVLNEHVTGRGQLECPAAVVVALEVEQDAALVGVCRQVQHPDAGDLGRDVMGQLRFGALDVQHVGAELAEQLGRPRADRCQGQVEDANPLEYPGHGVPPDRPGQTVAQRRRPDHDPAGRFAAGRWGTVGAWTRPRPRANRRPDRPSGQQPSPR